MKNYYLSLLISFTLLAVPTAHANKKEDSIHPDFITSFKRIEKLLRKEDMNKADKKIGEMTHYRDNNGLSEAEDAHYFLLTYWQAEHKGQAHKARESLEQMVQLGATRIDGKLFVPAAMQLFKFQVQERDYGAALETVAQLKREKDAEKQLSATKGLIGKLEKVVASEDPIFQDATLGANGVLTRTLIRPSFYLDKVEGNVDRYTIKCDKKEQDFPYSADGVLTIPKSWGTCKVSVHAEEGTTFSLVQFVNS